MEEHRLAVLTTLQPAISRSRFFRTLRHPVLGIRILFPDFPRQKTDIHSHLTFYSRVVGIQSLPEDQIVAGRTEVHTQNSVLPSISLRVESRVGLGSDMNGFHRVVCPQHTVSDTECALAFGIPFWRGFEGVADETAVTGAGQVFG